MNHPAPAAPPTEPQGDDDTDYWLEVKLYDLLRRLNAE